MGCRIHSVFVIAEAGVNHNGSQEMAHRLIDVAVDAGANAIKFQTFDADKLTTRSAFKADYQLARTSKNESQHAMLKGLQISKTGLQKLKSHADSAGIEFMSTPFDEDAIDFLVDDIGVKHLKISSGDLTHAPLLLKAASKKIPLILSTGMGTIPEIQEALGVLAFGYEEDIIQPSRRAFAEAYNKPHIHNKLQQFVTLLHCTSSYPTPENDVNLRAMATMKQSFGLPIGYSDHTLGITAAIAATALGATIIEKHFTADSKLPGPDHSMSLSPADLKSMIKEIRAVEQMLGDGEKKRRVSEEDTYSAARRSLVTLTSVRKGDTWNKQNMGAKRPGTGLPPTRMWEILGGSAADDYEADQLINPGEAELPE